MIYKDSMKSHSKYSEANEADMGMGEEELGDLSMNLNTSLQVLNDSEIDEDMPDENLENQLKSTSQTILQL